MVELWSYHGGYVAQLEHAGTIVMPQQYCEDNGITSLELAKEDVEKDLRRRGYDSRTTIREDKCS